jgi:hypothetical protein
MNGANPKPEGRNPKETRRPKAEMAPRGSFPALFSGAKRHTQGSTRCIAADFGPRISDLGLLSAFGPRPSDFTL